MDFSNVNGIAVPEGNVKYINNCLWTSLQFNQILDKGNFPGSGWQAINTSMSMSDNILKMTARATNGRVVTSPYRVNYIANHKYYARIEIKTTTETDKVVITGQAQILPYTVCTPSTEWQTISAIYTAPNTQVGTWVGIMDSRTSGWDEISARNYMIVDLTSMYGAGNEPTDKLTIETDCVIIGKDLRNYQPYKAV